MTWWSAGPIPAGPDKIMAALDGKTPSAVDLPLVKEMTARQGSFEPAGIMFIDAEHAPQGIDGPPSSSWPVSAASGSSGSRCDTASMTTPS